MVAFKRRLASAEMWKYDACPLILPPFRVLPSVRVKMIHALVKPEKPFQNVNKGVNVNSILIYVLQTASFIIFIYYCVFILYNVAHSYNNFTLLISSGNRTSQNE